MGVCQIIYLGILILGLGIALAKHGEPHQGNYNFGVSLVSVIIQVVLLYFGGFFG